MDPSKSLLWALLHIFISTEHESSYGLASFPGP